MSFHIGQRVVCVHDLSAFADERWVVDLGITLPVKGQIYTIRRLVQRPGPFADYGLMLCEIINPEVPLNKEQEGGFFEKDDKRLTFEEPAFDPRDFRPLEETRINIFRQHLVTPPKQGVDA